MVMYKRILSAVNEHLNSEITARYAMNLARACNARFYITFIAQKGMPEASFNKAEEFMKRLFFEAEGMNIHVECITCSGEPLDEMNKIVRHEDIDIVFASTRREDIERRFYVGTVARMFLLHLPCSVSIVRIVHAGRIHPRRVLVPLKAKINHIRERAYFVAKMAGAFNSKVSVLHVTRPVTRFFHGELHLTPEQWNEKTSADIREFIGCLTRYKIDHERRLTPGSTSRSITIEAALKRHDLIVMGASERNLIASILKGNPVEDVLRETPCDLMILKPRHEDQ